MFTGIISTIGTVRNVSRRNQSVHVSFKKPAGWKTKLGESINIDGVCSTVKRQDKDSFEVEYMPETLKKTTAGSLLPGSRVNLERSLKLGDAIDGHLVQGHVDTTGKVIEIKKRGDSLILKIQFPKQYRRFIAEKGSIAVHGVSLTVVAVAKDWFTVSLVGYTIQNTNLGALKKNSPVNLEMDVLIRYLDNFQAK